MNNREIKFRIWDEEHKTFYYPVGVETGRVIESKTGQEAYRHIRTTTLPLLIGLTLSGDIYESVYGECDLNKKMILQQFTGLLDKNGKEIYEDDIVALPLLSHHENKRRFVSRVELVNLLTWKNMDESPKEFYSSMEVIGNIFENPELLEL